jgi:hypothetical protein
LSIVPLFSIKLDYLFFGFTFAFSIKLFDHDSSDWMLEIAKHVTIYQVFFIGIDIYNSNFLYIYLSKPFFPTLQIEWTLILHLDVDGFSISIRQCF